MRSGGADRPQSRRYLESQSQDPVRRSYSLKLSKIAAAAVAGRKPVGSMTTSSPLTISALPFSGIAV